MSLPTENAATIASAASGATYLGVTLADANQIVQLVVGILTGVSLVVLILVNLKKLRDK